MASTAHASRDPSQGGLAYVLDDEPQVGTLVCRVLGACGFTPRQFTSPAPFMAEVRAMPPKLIALDLALGQSAAIEIIHLLELLKYKGKIVVISGRDDTTLAEVTQIGERHGLAMLPPLKKPFRVADLEQRLAPPNYNLHLTQGA
jgi:FixJ family two-component response regulator